MIRVLGILSLMAGPVVAETLVASHTMRPRHVLGPGDLDLLPDTMPGAVSDPSLLLGKEARVALYQGRPVRLADVGPPAVVERNQIIELSYEVAGLTITTEARALDRAASGETIRVMNLASRSTVSALIQEDGSAVVGR